MSPAETFSFVVGLFLAAVVLHYLASRLHVPPSAMLLVGGGMLAFVPGLPVIELNPELILVAFLPPLLADSAWFTALSSFRRNLGGILSLAVGAVLFTTVVVAVVTKVLVPALPWAACAALGAIVSPPDAVSARAILQRVRLPRRLNTLLEGESLLNDATGLVLLRFAVAAVVTGVFSFGAAAATFAMVAAGGVAVGGAVAAAWVVVVRRLGDDRSVIVASTLLSWVAYLAGEWLHVSGVIATVTAGLICGWYQHRLFRGSTRLRATASWQAMIFLLEAAVFILIGFSLRGVIARAGGVSVIVDSMGGDRPRGRRGSDGRPVHLDLWVGPGDLRPGPGRRQPGRTARPPRQHGARLGRDARRRHAGVRVDATGGDAGTRPDACNRLCCHPCYGADSGHDAGPGRPPTRPAGGRAITAALGSRCCRNSGRPSSTRCC